MNKKVLIISSSPRKGGNSETLAASMTSAISTGIPLWKEHIRSERTSELYKAELNSETGHAVP